MQLGGSMRVLEEEDDGDGWWSGRRCGEVMSEEARWKRGWGGESFAQETGTFRHSTA